MLYLLAAVGAVTIGVVLWKLMRLNHEAAMYSQPGQPRSGQPGQHDLPLAEPEEPQRRRVVGPDDDPEFLRALEERLRRGE